MQPGRANEADAAAGRRAHSRLRLRLPARIVTLTSSRRVILVDLSVTGARVINCGEIEAGERAVLQWHEFEAFGEVVWHASEACGLRFFDIVPPASLIATRDLHDAERLATDRELARAHAAEWVQGIRRV